ncbi:MAG: hypothetical protein KME06_02985 [Kastovskya adunca ATA6-11-RM4]|jgi:hypothetical protein|nr:hypothetical protein [Kastovskya adunca ATA6-11-RM4]
MHNIGDKVQAFDGRIGTVVDAKTMVNDAMFSNYQHIVVRFPDLSTMDGLSENFKAVFERPFAKLRDFVKYMTL